MKKKNCLTRLLILVFALSFVTSGFAKNTDYTKMLFEGVETFDFIKIKTAIKNGADVNAKNKYGYTPLHEAAYRKHPEICKLLIQHSADVNEIDKYIHTPIDIATGLNYLELVNLIKKYNQRK